jgi:hypothetical protein
MKSNEVKVGETYVAKVSGNLTHVRLDSIEEIPGRKANALAYSGRRSIRARTRYLCTNLRTGRQVSFRSAQKFRLASTPPERPFLNHGSRTAKANKGFEQAYAQPSQERQVIKNKEGHLIGVVQQEATQTKDNPTIRERLCRIMTLCETPHWTPERKSKIYDHALACIRVLNAIVVKNEM